MRLKQGNLHVFYIFLLVSEPKTSVARAGVGYSSGSSSRIRLRMDNTVYFILGWSYYFNGAILHTGAAAYTYLFSLAEKNRAERRGSAPERFSDRAKSWRQNSKERQSLPSPPVA